MIKEQISIKKAVFFLPLAVFLKFTPLLEKKIVVIKNFVFVEKMLSVMLYYEQFRNWNKKLGWPTWFNWIQPGSLFLS